MDTPSPSAKPQGIARLSLWYVLLVLFAIGAGFFGMFWAGDGYGGDGVLVVLAAVVLFWLLFAAWFGIKYRRWSVPILLLGLLVRHKPTAYGRATLGAKPFRRAPKVTVYPPASSEAVV